MLAGFTGFASENDPRFAAWRTAVDATAAVTRLMDYSAQIARGESGESWGAGFPITERTISYCLRREELFARSYTQYISLRSRDPDLNEWLGILTETPYNKALPLQWEPADFEPVAATRDALFREAKCRKS